MERTRGWVGSRPDTRTRSGIPRPAFVEKTPPLDWHRLVNDDLRMGDLEAVHPPKPPEPNDCESTEAWLMSFVPDRAR